MFVQKQAQKYTFSSTLPNISSKKLSPFRKILLPLRLEMKKLFITTLLLAVTVMAVAQETHYHKGLRSQEENDKYGGVASEPNFNGGGTYWSRTRNVDDVMITRETSADSIARRDNFKRLCQLAYDAYEQGDALHTVVYGDSALHTRYHTADLYYFMGVSYEQLGSTDEADWAYRHALGAGYPDALTAYNAFKQRQQQRKAAEKQKRKEEKRRKKSEKIK